MTTDLTQASAAALSALFRSKAASPVEALTAVLARAEAVNPRINALTLIDAEPAMAAARASEARWAKAEPLSPLDGVPVSVKELIRTKGWPQTMGSKLTDKAPATEDAPAVQRLREAGAVVFAQNTSPEYGFKGVTDSPLHGITRNPWNLDLTPGGSSGGSGAAVAAGLGPMALGTDGGGSVRIPSAFCGLVGLKATYGRIPAWPPSMHGDLANTGPMTRTTLDCALMLNQLSRPDPRDPFPAQPEDKDYTVGLDAGVKGLKIGLVMRFGDGWLDPDVEAQVTAAAKTLESWARRSSRSRRRRRAPTPARCSWSTGSRPCSACCSSIRPTSTPCSIRPAATGQDRRAIPGADPGRRHGRPSGDVHRLNLLFTRYDLVISPTLTVLPFVVGQPFPPGVDGKPLTAWSNTALFNLTRHPAITTPAGLSASGLPVGLQIVAAHYRDDLVLRASAALEAARPLAFPMLPA